MNALERIAEQLARIVDLETLRFKGEQASANRSQAQLDEFVELMKQQAEYTQRMRQRMEQEDMHRASCAQCRAHYYPSEGRGN